MDTIGLLAAWVGIVSCFCGVLLAIGIHVSTLTYRRLLAIASKKHARKRLNKLVLDLDATVSAPDNAYLADLISLYGSMILNLVAAIGLVMIAIEILDLGPALLASTLPFNVNAKLITRVTGIITLILSYYFIFRLCYLAVARIKIFRTTSGAADSISREIAYLRARVGSSL